MPKSLDERIREHRRQREGLVRELAAHLPEDFLFRWGGQHVPMREWLRLTGADVGETLSFDLTNLLDLLKAKEQERPSVSSTYACPHCGDEVDIRKARPL